MKKEIIGNATLYHGDCFEVLPTIDPKEIDLVATDPPYLFVSKMKGGGFCKTRKYFTETLGFTDCGVDYGFLEGFENWFVFCSKIQIPELFSRAITQGSGNLITWCKPNPIPTCNNKYLPDVEFIVHGWQKGRLFGSYRDKSSFVLMATGKKETDHPNEKPIYLIQKLLRLGSKEGETILDPFMGSGTTGEACHLLNRKFIGIEIEEKYFDIACKRIDQAQRQGKLFA